jgi:nucleoside-diphosphate-sugar epimerase
VRVLVTGAGGFIGAATAGELLARGHAVACLVRDPDAVDGRVPWVGHAEVISGDLMVPEGWADAVRAWRPEACVHAAWFTHPATYLHAPENVWLLDAGLRLIDVLAAAGCRRAVFVGTCAEYDTSGSGALDESSATRPSTLYASCKLALAMLGRRRAESAGIRFAWARLFHPYGPREHPDRLIPSAIRALAGGSTFTSSHPEARREFVHVDDVAAALAVMAECAPHGVFNLSAGSPASVREVLTTLGALAGRPDLLRFASRPRPGWDPDSIAGPNDLLRAATGWQPRIALADGLASDFAWWSRQAAEAT